MASKSVTISTAPTASSGTKDESKINSNDKTLTASTKNANPAPLKEAVKALEATNGDSIVDIKVSKSEKQDTEFSRSGYTQLLQEHYKTTKRSSANSGASTFGNQVSIWIWRRSQGTCSGRLKPIVDIQLDIAPVSSDFVLSGYLCDSVPINGQWLWTKRASNDEEEKDAIVDLYITTGKLKDATDPIWQSPGLGWIRIDGNFTKGMFSNIDTLMWFRPSRTRSLDSQVISPIRSAVSLTEELRQIKIMASVRIALRHHVHLEDIKRLANLSMDSQITTGGSIANQTMVRSQRLLDFSALFHKYESNGELKKTKFSSLLLDMGLKLTSQDITNCYSNFDLDLKGSITMDEYVDVLKLTEFELDLAAERIRVKLLSSGVANVGSTAGEQAMVGVIGTAGAVSSKHLGTNLIRENLIAVHIFRMINIKGDNVLSLDEIMDLASKIEVFLSEEEALALLNKFDINNDGRVEEPDFVAFMKRESLAISNKSYRLQNCASLLRRWLVRGTTEKVTSTASASLHQWKQFETRYKKATNLPFPGFINSQFLTLILAGLGVRLTAAESRELTLIIAPEKNGRIHQAELHSFMGTSCRGIGELVAFIEREFFKDLITAYQAHYESLQINGKEDFELADNYRRKLDTLKKEVENVYVKREALAAAAREAKDDGSSSQTYVATLGNESRAAKARSHEVVSVLQLKESMEELFKDKKLSEHLLINLEEWATLAILFNSNVTEGDVYGIKPKIFFENLCKYVTIYTKEVRLKAGEKASIDVVSRELRMLINVEAKHSSKNGKPDYRAAFDLFDENKNGIISVEEFKATLIRLQLISHLSNHQVPTLLSQFEKSKKGQISFDDFMAYVNEGNNKDPYGDVDEDIDDTGADIDDDYIEGMTSNNPPVAISKNADCDWLLWFLYKQACKLEPLDPESVITELQSVCHDSAYAVDDSNVTVKDLWNILFELGLHGVMTTSQFIKGIQFLSRNGHGRDEDVVNYDALCSYVIRMGRAFHSLVQERSKIDESKFVPLAADLKKYFKDLSEEKTTDGKSGSARYEKLFRRLDKDGDGMLTRREFKVGLRKLHFKDEKLWSMRMIGRLFDECDQNRDGLLSIKEFGEYILGKANLQLTVSNQNDSKTNEGGKGKGSKGSLDLSDDEQDEIFKKSRSLTDMELIRKVNEVLHDVVPFEGLNKEKHTDAVRSSVRRFFQRADPEFKGYVGEERFRAFLRRSGLQDQLTASELRRLTDKLKKRNKGIGLDNKPEFQINYEKLCQLLTYSTDSVPRSKADIIFSRLQDAANASNAIGRSFLSLCSLVDLRLTGTMTKEEFIHTCKMMDLPITFHDLDALLELLPSHKVSKDGNTINYRAIQDLLDHYTPRLYESMADLEPKLTTRKLPGALPSYATPFTVTSLMGNGHGTPGAVLARSNGVDPFRRSVTTPIGLTINTPYAYNDRYSNQPNPMLHSTNQTSSFDRMMRILGDRIKLAIEEKSRQWNAPYSLRRQFESNDLDNTGMIPLRAVHTTLHDIGIILGISEQHMIASLYGRPEDDSVYYDSFCRGIDNAVNGQTVGLLQPVMTSNYGTNRVIETTSSINAPYLSHRVLQRFRELRMDRRDPRDMFEAHDLDRSGCVSVHKFRDVINSLQLLQSEHQLHRTEEDFGVISNRSFICYDDFCSTLEKADNNNNNEPSLRSRGTGFVNGNGYDGLRRSMGNSERVNYGTSGVAYDDDDDESQYNRYNRSSANDNVNRFKQALNRSSTTKFPIELEEGSDSNNTNYYPPLSPPKLTDSINGNSTLKWRSSSPNRSNNNRSLFMSNDDLSSSFNKSQSQISAPRASPSKVGSKMWGNDTPLNKKGNAPWIADNKWCCAVCLYVENPNSKQRCVVCDSPNYALRKDYQIKEQCLNCTFQNGQFAEECEMCGEPLSHSTKSTSNNTNKISRW
eukprot:gene5601-7730_t